MKRIIKKIEKLNKMIEWIKETLQKLESLLPPDKKEAEKNIEIIKKAAIAFELYKKLFGVLDIEKGKFTIENYTVITNPDNATLTPTKVVLKKL